MLRSVEPELADHLAYDDPRAIRFRRDLRRVNALMMSDWVIARALRKHRGAAAPRVIVDLGTGDGTVMLHVARRLAPQWRNVTVILVDQQDIVSAQTRDGFAALGWNVQTEKADIFEFLARPRPDVDIVTANAFLHHFTAERLTLLFGHAARMAGLFVACEPRRSWLGREASRCLWMLGCGEVVIQDAVTSVRAGFVGTEMSQSWPQTPDWVTEERDAGPFLHLFTARRA